MRARRLSRAYRFEPDERFAAHCAYAFGYVRANTDVRSFRAVRTLDVNSSQSTHRKEEVAYSGSNERVHGGQQKMPLGSPELNACLITQNKTSLARCSYSLLALT